MSSKPTNIVIINRSFWPTYPVIGEALLKFAEVAVKDGHSVSVILQDHANIKESLASASRGKGVSFHPAKARTTSASGITSRIIDSIFFAFWVIKELLRIRPDKIYVSTDPPVFVPFLIMLFCRLFGGSYVYHLQDIHPEAAGVVIPIHRWLFGFLVKMDSLTMRRAESLITITKSMADEIFFRSRTKVPIHILNNPAISFDGIDMDKPKIEGFSFCGNAGRLQRIPLIMEAIEHYFKQGGKLEFTFAGGGVYTNRLVALADKYPNFHFAGLVSPFEAAQINADYTWALLPIEDGVTTFAFPSKLSSYVFSGANILAVCGEQTSVAKWVRSNRVGEVVKPQIAAVTEAFFAIEEGEYMEFDDLSSREALKVRLRFEVFVEHINKIVLG
ncbi:glycosyltransferase [Candidatus Puniceispirillum sp.]|nr:glycosyltransferase [Candidatus Puniceispirillum sp.]